MSWVQVDLETDGSGLTPGLHWVGSTQVTVTAPVLHTWVSQVPALNVNDVSDDDEDDPRRPFRMAENHQALAWRVQTDGNILTLLNEMRVVQGRSGSFSFSFIVTVHEDNVLLCSTPYYPSPEADVILLHLSAEAARVIEDYRPLKRKTVWDLLRENPYG